MLPYRHMLTTNGLVLGAGTEGPKACARGRMSYVVVRALRVGRLSLVATFSHESPRRCGQRAPDDVGIPGPGNAISDHPSGKDVASLTYAHKAVCEIRTEMAYETTHVSWVVRPEPPAID